jgi:protein-S-isoprenylcysteine O-methyltransferase Ste14
VVEGVRYGLGVLGVIMLLPGLLLWAVIHPWARWWRRLGPLRTYLIVVPPLGALGALLFRIRGRLLGADLGTNWSLIAVAMVFYGASAYLELKYWKHLSIATAAGVQELLPTQHPKNKLLRDGIYRVVRHPRYLSAGIGVLGNALVINYAGMYILVLLLFPMGYAFVLLPEERELIDRFGDEYLQYQREVPRLLPRLRRAKRE